MNNIIIENRSISPLFFSSIDQPTNAIEFQDIKNLEPDMTSAGTPNPGFLSLVLFPYTLFSNIFSCVRAYRNDDAEEAKDAITRLCAMPFYALQSLILGTSTIFQVLTFLGYTLTFLAISPFITAGLGIGLSIFEGIIEGIGIYRADEFRSEIRQIGELPQNAEEEKDQLRNIQAFCKSYVILDQMEYQEINGSVQNKFPNLKDEPLKAKQTTALKRAWTKKYLSLGRRCSPWCAKEISEKFLVGGEANIFYRLQSGDFGVKQEAQREIQDVFKMLDDQAKKKLIVHIVGIVALTIMVIGFVASLFFPPAIPFFLLTSASVLISIRYLMEYGFWGTKGWTFSPVACLPDFLRKCFDRCSGNAIPA